MIGIVAHRTLQRQKFGMPTFYRSCCRPRLLLATTTTTGRRKMADAPTVPTARSLSDHPAGPPSQFASIDDEITHANHRYQDAVVIRPTPHGHGLFALRQFQPGETVMRAQFLHTFDVASSHTIQVDWNVHVWMDLPARFINHGCHVDVVNVGVQMMPPSSSSSSSYCDFVARRVINAWDELRYDYATTEYAMNGDWTCACGSRHCRVNVYGYRVHGPDVRARYGDNFIAPYLLQNTRS